MLDTKLDLAAASDKPSAASADDQVRSGDAADVEVAADEELADEVIVEISVDGMCGVY